MFRSIAVKAISITKDLVYHVIDEVFQKEKVAYILGPYEADAQLA
jgi:hypothetical protein